MILDSSNTARNQTSRYSDHHDAVPSGLRSRFSSFRRVGSDAANAQPPPRVDLLPFLAAVARLWPTERVGPFLNQVSLSTELYDDCAGSVRFHGPPTFEQTRLNRSVELATLLGRSVAAAAPAAGPGSTSSNPPVYTECELGQAFGDGFVSFDGCADAPGAGSFKCQLSTNASATCSAAFCSGAHSHKGCACGNCSLPAAHEPLHEVQAYACACSAGCECTLVAAV